MPMLGRIHTAVVLTAAALLAHPVASHEEAPDLKTAQDVEDYERLTTPKAKKLIQAIDKDKDGRASKEEMAAFAQDMRLVAAQNSLTFVMEGDGHALGRDTNKDGKLSKEEFLAGDMIMGLGKLDLEVEKQKFKLADKDGDGYLVGPEVVACFFPETHEGVLEILADQSLRRKDTNRDGRLTLEEFWFGDVPIEHHYPLNEEHDFDFKNTDLNGDGVVDIKELMRFESGAYHMQKALEELFEIADANKDGFMTSKELVSVRDELEDKEMHYHMVSWMKHLEL